MKINKVVRTGASFTVPIPRRYFTDKGINPGDYVIVKNYSDSIRITKLPFKFTRRRKKSAPETV